MKALVGAFNQENALVGDFSVIVQLHRLIDLGHYTTPPPLARGPVMMMTARAAAVVPTLLILRLYRTGMGNV